MKSKHSTYKIPVQMKGELYKNTGKQTQIEFDVKIFIRFDFYTTGKAGQKISK